MKIILSILLATVLMGCGSKHSLRTHRPMKTMAMACSLCGEANCPWTKADRNKAKIRKTRGERKKTKGE